MEKSNSLLAEFKSSLDKGESFSVIGCIRDMFWRDSLPHPYFKKDEFTLGAEPPTLKKNIEINFFSYLKKFIDPKDWTIVISQEGIFNKMSHFSRGFCPIEFKLVFLDELSIISLFKNESKNFPKAFFFFNIVSSKTQSLTPELKEKIKLKIDGYNSKLDNPIIFPKILSEKERKDLKPLLKSQYDYLLFPFSQNLDNYEEINAVSNKTIVIINGEIIATYKKRVMAKCDFEEYIDNKKKGGNTNIIRYFNSGTLGKAQLKYSEFFKLFGLEICFDYRNNILYKDFLKSKKLPLFHILQSDSISSDKTTITNGYFLHIDSLSENIKIASVQKGILSEKTKREFDEIVGNFRFIGWKDINSLV